MSYQYWSEDEVSYIKNNYGILPIKAIAETLGRSVPSIKHKIERGDIQPQKEYKWTEAELEYLKSHYKEKTYNEIALYLGRTKAAVDIKINQLGLKKSKYHYNAHYFSTITTPNQAYWLGFICADGGVSCQFINGQESNGEVSLKLQARDAGHLRLFNKALEGNVPVTFDRRDTFGTGKQYDMCQIRFYSLEMVQDLKRLRGDYAKKNCRNLPNIDASLRSHFIRGFFDGDGCLTITTGKNHLVLPQCDFSIASLDIAQQLRAWLLAAGIKSYICEEQKPNGQPTLFRLRIGGLINTDKFLSYIYQDSNPENRLWRKWALKGKLYKEYNFEQRLLRLSERAG